MFEFKLLFLFCRSCLYKRLQKTEGYIMCLPVHQRNLLDQYKSNLKFIEECLDKNQHVIDKIVQGVPYIFENINPDFLDGVDDVSFVIESYQLSGFMNFVY